jgi:hypothetical protein
MTLIVGIRCADDAVVLASDSAATFGVAGNPTIAQMCAKIDIIRGEALIGVSGPVGLGQRFHGELDKEWARTQFRNKTAVDIMTHLRRQFHPHIEDEFKAAQVAAPMLGGAAGSSAMSHTLIAMPIYKENTVALFQFDQQGAPEMSTDKLPFVCVGSGQVLADPFLAFLKDVFWDGSGYPKLQTALFTAIWTVQQSIAVAPAGIGGPIHVCTLTRDDGAWKASELTSDQLQEHQQAIGDARQTLADFRKSMQAAPAVNPPAPPAVPSADGKATATHA